MNNCIVEAFIKSWPVAQKCDITVAEQTALLIYLKYGTENPRTMEFEPYQGKEDDLQKSLMRYVNAAYPRERYLYCHIPNGGFRNAAEGAKFKALGVRPGMPDLMFFTQRPRPGMQNTRYTGLTIELKVGRNKKTPSQDDVANMLIDQGWKVCTTNSLDEAIHMIDQYFTA